MHPRLSDHLPRKLLDQAMQSVPPAQLAEWQEALARIGEGRGLKFYPEPGRPRRIHLTARPWIVTRPQRRLMQRMFLALDDATRRLPRIARDNPDVAALLPFDPRERPWMTAALGPDLDRPQTLLGRVDCVYDLGSPDWAASLKILETNMVGVGASYYSWVASRTVHEVVGPWLEKTFGRKFRPDDDVVDLILGSVRDHAALTGRRCRAICLLEEAVDSGPMEFPSMADLLRRRGHDVVVADPGEIGVRKGQLFAADKAVDFLYRDPTVVNLLEMEEEGRDLAGVKWAFRENRVVSGFAGEFDQKGALELYSSPRWEKLFPAASRKLFAGHIAWTRVVREFRTTDPSGKNVDLLPYLRRRRTRLVLKPNRDYGGHGIIFGDEQTPAAWDRALDRAVRSFPGWVAQSLTDPVKELYPTGDPDEPWSRRVTIGGFTATPHGVAMLARLSQSRIVNITRDGGIAGVLVLA